MLTISILRVIFFFNCFSWKKNTVFCAKVSGSVSCFVYQGFILYIEFCIALLYPCLSVYNTWVTASCNEQGLSNEIIFRVWVSIQLRWVGVSEGESARATELCFLKETTTTCANAQALCVKPHCHFLNTKDQKRRFKSHHFCTMKLCKNINFSSVLNLMKCTRFAARWGCFDCVDKDRLNRAHFFQI